MSRPLPSPNASKIEVDQRSREARLRLEQVEGLLVPWVPSTRCWVGQSLYRLCPSIRQRAAEDPIRAGSKNNSSGNEPDPTASALIGDAGSVREPVLAGPTATGQRDPAEFPAAGETDSFVERHPKPPREACARGRSDYPWQ
jgi:hypothetical protein